MYHYVRNMANSSFPRIKALGVSEFDYQINYLRENYSIISMNTLLSAISNNSALPKNAALLTFDDGYIDHYTNVFPLLKRYNISGCFYPSGKAIIDNIVLDVNKIHFILASIISPMKLIGEIFDILNVYRKRNNIYSNEYYYKKLCVPNSYDNGDIIFIKRLLQRELPYEIRRKIIDLLFYKYVTTDEKGFSEQLYMNSDNLREMISEGMHIGSHGYDHLWIDTLDHYKQTDEIDKSRQYLNSIGENLNNWTICYPYGAYNNSLLRILGKYECRIGLIVGGRIADITVDKMLLLPRIDTNQIPIR
jgi:peptidoglycan/xylan/chitin deacetylase (PgdA/CDA1 family)